MNFSDHYSLNIFNNFIKDFHRNIIIIKTFLLIILLIIFKKHLNIFNGYILFYSFFDNYYKLSKKTH